MVRPQDPSHGFKLHVEVEETNCIVHLRLANQDGVHLAAAQVKLEEHSLAMWQALFDTRTYVERYAGNLRPDSDDEPKSGEEILADIGVFLGQQVLGAGIMSELSGIHDRTLLLELPASSDNPLAVAFANVPWDIARPDLNTPPLFERNVVVRVAIPDTAPVTNQVEQADPLRVLLVFAEAPGSRPLSMRLERENLRGLFFNEILPQRRVELDVLCHGVTRARLEEIIMSRCGYAIIHWSGHGHCNCLEMLGDDGRPEMLSGQDLVKLISDAGGFIPQLMFLSACLSGTPAELRGWEDLKASMIGTRRARKQINERELRQFAENQTGYTSMALQLLRAGVPQVLGMRYEVGDGYARELAQLFYRRLLADKIGHSPEKALSLARGELARAPKDAPHGFEPADHATPLLFGHAQPPIRVRQRPSKQLLRGRPQPQPLLPGASRDLDTPMLFVGRSRELTRLANDWLPRGRSAVAVVQGMAGLGKTTIAAEAIHLWHARFDKVLAFQAKPEPLRLEEFYHELDLRLRLHSGAYRDTCEYSPNSGVCLPLDGPLKGPARYEQMRVNLVEALRNESILLVLDNFENNLESVGAPKGSACLDPGWGQLLTVLADQLPPTASRVLITSRHRLEVLSDPSQALWLPLGPLPPSEAVLYIHSHDALCRLYHSGNAGQDLVWRLLLVSRGHPLVLDRLAALSPHPKDLACALDRLQAKGGWEALPDLFAGARSAAERDRERAYLEDAAVGGVDLLIERVSAEARRLLWTVTLASEPVGAAVLEAVWTRKSLADRMLEKSIEAVPSMSEDDRAKFEAYLASDVGRKQLESLEISKALPQPAPVRELLSELHEAGLLGLEGENHPVDTPHDLVRQRIKAWMEEHQEERGDRTPEEIWRAYGMWYATLSETLQSDGRALHVEQGVAQARRALTYLLRARAFDRLGSFVGGLVTSTRHPILLRAVAWQLREAIDQVPGGTERWTVHAYLADALRNSGRPDEALVFYEYAANEALRAERFSLAGWMLLNWGSALATCGELSKAKHTFERGAEAYRKAESPRIDVLSCEMEALRIEVQTGAAAQVWPKIWEGLRQVREWWRWLQLGQDVPEARHPVQLALSLVGALDIAFQAHSALNNWQLCLDLLDEADWVRRVIRQEDHELAITRLKKCGPLINLGLLDEAQRVAELCLEVFRASGDLTRQAKTLSVLGAIWNERQDSAQAIALERQALTVINRTPHLVFRASSHGHLSAYLDRAGQVPESASHLLAALVYSNVAGLDQRGYLQKLALRLSRTSNIREAFKLPRLQELLAQPEFDPLKQFLVGHQVDLGQLQETLDQLVDQAWGARVALLLDLDHVIEPTIGWMRHELGLALANLAQTKRGEEADRLFEAAGQRYAEALKIKPDLDTILYNWGVALAAQARNKQGEEADRLFEAAGQKYAEALKIKPDNSSALYNWGNAVSDQAEAKDGAEADRLFAAAQEKYARASKIKPDMAEALSRWGQALAAQAATKQGSEAEQLLKLAEEKYAEAVRCRPDDHEGLYNWGRALIVRAQMKEYPEAERLFSAAGDKFASALKIKPNMIEALHDLGLALFGQAKAKQGEEANQLFAAAMQKFAEALQVEPELPEALNGWGAVLLAQAEFVDSEEEEQLLRVAGQKLTEALRIKPTFHEALHNLGHTLASQAKGKEGEEAAQLLREAGEKFAESLRIKPDKYNTLYEWGRVLLDQATGEEGSDADRLFDGAREKFEQALKIKPDDPQSLFCCGFALATQAGIRQGEEAERLRETACEKFCETLRIDPEDPAALYLWGKTLCERAIPREGEDADRLFTEADQKFAKALSIKPDFEQALYDWGSALATRAQQAAQPDEAARLFKAAEQKFDGVLSIKPGNHEALCNLGAALSARAREKEGREAEELLDAAERKLSEALQIQPDMQRALNEWGIVLMVRGRSKQGEETDRLLGQAEEKFNAALRIKPDMIEARNNLGRVLSDRAQMRQGPEADHLFRATGQEFGEVLRAKPDSYMTVYNWVVALSAQAQRKEGEQADQLLETAWEKCTRALELRPDLPAPLVAYVTALINLSKREPEEKAAKLRKEAREKLLLAEAIQCGSGSYNLACLEALAGNAEKAVDWLRQHVSMGLTLSKRKLIQDVDFDLVRDEAAFCDFFTSLPEV